MLFHINSKILNLYLHNLRAFFVSYRHEAELAQAAAQPLPDDDDDAFE